MGIPADENYINGLIETAELEMNEKEKVYWETIKINPVKWHQSPWGDDGGGFWVVARYGNYIVWYNDIEEGFNESLIIKDGEISYYACNQTSLSDFIKYKIDRFSANGCV